MAKKLLQSSHGRIPERIQVDFWNETLRRTTNLFISKCCFLHLPTYLHTYLPTYTRTYLPTYTRTYLPTYLHTYLRTYTPTYVPSENMISESVLFGIFLHELSTFAAFDPSLLLSLGFKPGMAWMIPKYLLSFCLNSSAIQSPLGRDSFQYLCAKTVYGKGDVNNSR